jgi:hypothetical protein
MVPSGSVVIRLLEIAFWTAVRLHPRIRAYALRETPIMFFLKISLAFQAKQSDESWCAETRKPLSRKD